MNSHRQAHRDMVRHLCENLDQKLNSPECRRIRRHLNGCPGCANFLDSLKFTIRLYRRYPAPALSRKARKNLALAMKKLK